VPGKTEQFRRYNLASLPPDARELGRLILKPAQAGQEPKDRHLQQKTQRLRQLEISAFSCHRHF
jgi:hypothetical protein